MAQSQDEVEEVWFRRKFRSVNGWRRQVEGDDVDG